MKLPEGFEMPKTTTLVFDASGNGDVIVATIHDQDAFQKYLDAAIAAAMEAKTLNPKG